jgi:ribose transport system substrate-binding protein
MKLAVFTKNFSNPAYAAARLGAERAAAMFGAEVVHHVPQTPDDPEQQSALVHEALAGKPDAFVFTPVHPSRVNDAIAAIRAAGVPIFGFVNRMEPGLAESYVGASDTRLASDIAAYLMAHLRGRGRVAIVEGPADSITSQERVAAFEAAVRLHPGIHIVARCDGRYQREPARHAFAALLKAHEGIDAVLAANDIMAIGVLDALQATGREATVVGVNAIPQAIDAIRAGRMLATADFNAMQMCFLATECAIRSLRGEAVPREIELPVAIVDRSNCEQWDLPYERRPLATLKEIHP